MAYLTHVGTNAGGSDAFVSGISDLVSYTSNKGPRVATISVDGQWIEIRNPDGNFSLMHRVFVGNADGLTAPARLELCVYQGSIALMSFGPQGAPMTAHVLNSNGRVAFSVPLDGAVGRISSYERVEAEGGKVLVFTAGQDGSGITCWQERSDGTWAFEATLDLGGTPGARDVADMAQITAHGATWLLTLSAQDNAVNLLHISATGQFRLTHRLDAQGGLPVANPTAVDVVQMGGKTFVLMAAAGTSSISVMQLDATGKLVLVDQVNDDLNTRFQSLTQMEVIEVEGRVFVVVGGADDGISLLTLLPDGRLLHLETLADSTVMALENLTGLSLLLRDGTLRIFASGEGGIRVSELTVDLGQLGAVMTASNAAVNLVGTGGDDILQGNNAANRLDGKGGDDILIDGKGEDRLTGGSGADTFIFAADGRRDIIEDFELGIDTIDLSGMGRAYSMNAFTFQSMSDGIKIIYQGEELRIYSHNGRSLDQSDFQLTDLMGLWHIDTTPVVQPDQTLIGAGANDALVGGTGDDVLRGEAVRPVFDTPAGQVYRVFLATLGRGPNREGHADWTDRLASGTMDLNQVIEGFVGSVEFRTTYGATSDSAFVTLLFQNVLDRPPNAAGLADWVGQLQSGAKTRAEVVAGFSESAEFRAKTLAESLTMSFAGYQADYIDDVYRLFRATLDREPGAIGLLDWARQLADGADYLDIVAGFVNSREFQTTYGNANNQQFVTLLFDNVLGRAPNPEGLAYWTGQLADGTLSREEVVQGFAQSREFKAAMTEPMTAFLRSLGENDRLEGGGGSDVLYGGVLSDTFVFAAFDGGNHVVVDLEAWDQIELQGFGYGGAGGALAQFDQVGDDVVFDDQGVTVRFQGVDLGDISSQMLVLV